MNAFLTAALVLSVTAIVHGKDDVDSTSTPEPTPEPKGKKESSAEKNAAAAVAAAAAAAAAAKDAKADKDDNGTKTDAQPAGKGVKNGEEAADKNKNPKGQQITFKKGKLKKPQKKPMNDSPSAGKTPDKKKDVTKATKGAKGDAGTGKTATVTVAQDTATRGNGVTSHHVTNWKLFVAIATILSAFLRI